MTDKLTNQQVKIGKDVFELPVNTSFTAFPDGNFGVCKKDEKTPNNVFGLVASVQPRALKDSQEIESAVREILLDNGAQQKRQTSLQI